MPSWQEGVLNVEALPGIAEQLAIEDDYGEVFAPRGAPEIEEVFGRVPNVAVRQPVKFPRPDSDAVFTVNYDRCTRVSGNQRAFADCPFHRDERCRRYVFTCHFEPHKHAAAWLCAWAFALPRASCKAAHYGQEPSEEQVLSFLQQAS